MIAVVRSAGATVANRALQLVVQSPSGFLRDVVEASFQILDASTAERAAAPVQVFPAVDGNRQVVDLVAHRIGTGRYAAVWAPVSDAAVGRYVVRWYYREVVGGPEFSFDQEFELLTRPYFGPAYCTIYDLASSGLTGAADDGLTQQLIVQASRFIEHYTKRQFYPLFKSVTFSGRRGRSLFLNEPIVAVEGLSIDSSGVFSLLGRSEAGSYRVFNRHLTQNLLSPDDRENPKLEFLSGWGSEGHTGEDGVYYDRFLSGVQNVQVTGIFGYTEPDGSATGGTPHLIRHVCKLLCFKQRYEPNSSQRLASLRDGRVKSEYTRDQGFILFDPQEVPTPGVGLTHTTDPEIDAILAGFRRGPSFGAA